MCDCLHRIVRLLLQMRRFERAAVLQGAVDRQRALVGHPLNPSERAGHLEMAAAIAEGLPAAEREVSLSRGIALTLEEAAELALSEGSQ